MKRTGLCPVFLSRKLAYFIFIHVGSISKYLKECWFINRSLLLVLLFGIKKIRQKKLDFLKIVIPNSCYRKRFFIKKNLFILRQIALKFFFFCKFFIFLKMYLVMRFISLYNDSRIGLLYFNSKNITYYPSISCIGV